MHLPVADRHQYQESKLNYVFEYANRTNGGNSDDWLNIGEKITSATVTNVDPSSLLTILAVNIINAGTQIEVWVKDGVMGETYKVKCIAVTDQLISGTAEYRTKVSILHLTIIDESA